RRPLAVAGDLVALPARRAVVEQRRAQRRVPRAVPLRVQVAVSARPAHGARRVRAAVERRVRLLPLGRRSHRVCGRRRRCVGRGRRCTGDCEQHQHERSSWG
ncbi:Os02g0268500, partial [Oryza sativa Japonica Group]